MLRVICLYGAGSAPFLLASSLEILAVGAILVNIKRPRHCLVVVQVQ